MNCLIEILRINEVNFNGSVGQVEVTNDSRYYLYILDGEAISELNKIE